MSIQTGNLRFLTCFGESLQTVSANYSLNRSLEQVFLSRWCSPLFQVSGHFPSHPGGALTLQRLPRTTPAPSPSTPFLVFLGSPGVSL